MRAKDLEQHYGGTGLDARLLLIAISGFLPPQDLRVVGTIDAIQRQFNHATIQEKASLL